MSTKFLNFQPEGSDDQIGGKFGWSKNLNEHFNENFNERVCGGALVGWHARALLAREKKRRGSGRGYSSRSIYCIN